MRLHGAKEEGASAKGEALEAGKGTLAGGEVAAEVGTLVDWEAAEEEKEEEGTSAEEGQRWCR